MEQVKEDKHFVLIHGTGTGAWLWYKLKLQLESAGHRVTSLDMSASGINPKSLEQVRTFEEYSMPLLDMMDSVPENEKVILVAHSLGGLNSALAMEKYPHKVSVAVYLAALMPDTIHAPSYVVEEVSKSQRSSTEYWMDTQFPSFGDTENPRTSLLLGPKFLSSMVYQLCSPEDMELGRTLTRAGTVFNEDLAKANKFTNEGFGSVKRVYIVIKYDKALNTEFQEWLIQNNPAEEVYEIKGANHMAMLSQTNQLYLPLHIATKHAN